MMDWDRDQLHSRYRLCSAGLRLAAIGVGFAALNTAAHLLVMVTMDFRLFELVAHPAWIWGIGGPSVIGSLFGAYLLFGRWDEPSWKRRTGVLVLVCLAHVASWALQHADVLGGGQAGLSSHEWFLMNLSRGLGWAKLMLFAGLAADVSAHLGHQGARVGGKVAWKFAATGAVIWAFYFAARTDWNGGWPLGIARFGPLLYLMLLTYLFDFCLASLQVAALCLAARAHCRSMLDELEKSEPQQAHGLANAFAGLPDERFRADGP